MTENALRRTVPFSMAVNCDIRIRSKMKSGWLPPAFLTVAVRPIQRQQATPRNSCRALVPYVHTGEIC
jgi:hypothetical protein